MSVINANPLMLGDAGYNIERSLRFRSSASAYLNRTPASAGNRQKWTWSGWTKLGSIDANGHALFAVQGASGTDYFGIVTGLNAANDLAITELVSATNQIRVATTAVYRDPSAWYHVVVSYDSTAAIQDNRLVLYVNNTVQSLSGTKVALNYSCYVNSTRAHQIGRTLQGGGTAGNYFDGYLAEVNFIDGQALTPSSFGQTDAVTGVWTPKKYTGTYGTNGFYLDFKNNTSATTLAYDKSGNGNNWTANNISTTAGATYDSMTDVPTLTSATAANYCVVNPLKAPSGNTVTTSNANLTVSYTSHAYSTIAVTSGKWYWECVWDSGLATSFGIAGSQDYSYITTGGSQAIAYVYNATKYVSSTNTSYGASFAKGDVIGAALDIDSGTITFYKNNVSQGSITLLTTPDGGWMPAVWSLNATCASTFNFGQRPFAYTPPTGFKALNTFNLPDPVIKKPNQYMDATTYTGNGLSTRTISGVSFQPDFIWTKSRSISNYHNLYDSSRGFGSAKSLNSNSTDSEGTYDKLYGYISAATSSGFSVANGTDGSQPNAYTNQNGITYVGWQWKKGATPGFDIVTYTGTGSGNITVNHSLGVTPAMWIIKNRTLGTTDWLIGHKSLPANYYLLFNTNAQSNASTPFVSQSSSNIVLSGSQNLAQNYVAYLFAEIAGFSKFGSYTGNGSADGPFVYCGFRPKYVMFKRTDSADNWNILDTSRDTYNLSTLNVQANLANAENSSPTDRLDFLSNGFKQRGTGGGGNASGGTYIYAAFAESPFKTSNAR